MEGEEEEEQKKDKTPPLSASHVKSISAVPEYRPWLWYEWAVVCKQNKVNLKRHDRQC